MEAESEDIDPGDRDFFDSTQTFHAIINSTYNSNNCAAHLPTTQEIENQLLNRRITSVTDNNNNETRLEKTLLSA